MTSIAAPQLASELASLASSTSAAPVQLQLGQILSGTVIALLNDTILRLQTSAGQIDLAADTPLPAGTPVTITVGGSAQQPRIVITPIAGGARQSVPQLPEAASESNPQTGTGSAATISTLVAQAIHPQRTSSSPAIIRVRESLHSLRCKGLCRPESRPKRLHRPQRCASRQSRARPP
jgi:hypothetical protein